MNNIFTNFEKGLDDKNESISKSPYLQKSKTPQEPVPVPVPAPTPSIAEETVNDLLNKGKKKAELLKNQADNGNITHCEAMAQFADYLYEYTKNNIIADEVDKRKIMMDTLIRVLTEKVEGDPWSNNREYYVDFGYYNTGFKDEYSQIESNQVRHFVGWASAGWYHNDIASAIALPLREITDPGRYADILLGIKGIEFGSNFLTGKIQGKDVGRWIRENICK